MTSGKELCSKLLMMVQKLNSMLKHKAHDMASCNVGVRSTKAFRLLCKFSNDLNVNHTLHSKQFVQHCKEHCEALQDEWYSAAKHIVERCNGLCKADHSSDVALTRSGGFSMSDRAPEAVACLLSIALSSDTRLSDLAIELSRGDSELALGESGSGSPRLLALDRGPPRKKPLLEGLIIRAALELLLAGGELTDRNPTVSS